MKKTLTGALAALTVGGALAASAVPAAAEPHGWHGGGDRGWHGGGYRGWRGDGYRGWRGDGYGWGGAAAAGLIGLAAGAALAGAYSPYPAYDYYVPACRIEMRWNPYWGGYERVRVCY